MEMEKKKIYGKIRTVWERNRLENHYEKIIIEIKTFMNMWE